MNTDIRISVHFYDNPKTVKLERKLGSDGSRSLQLLWMWAAINRPNGDLTGLDNEDIEIVARWKGEPTTFVTSLTALNWLDGSEGNYRIHDWKKHQPEALRRYRHEQSGGYDANGNRLFPEDWQDIKAAIYRRDGRQCQYCCTTEGPFHIDHVIPRIKGGPDTMDNLVVACTSCNLSKGSKDVSEWLGVVSSCAQK